MSQTLTINTNISSMIAQRSLNSATQTLNNSIERLTTGYTINHASDNAAGRSISNNWTTQLGTLDVAASNAAMGADMLTTTEESYDLLVEHLQRIRDLTEQAANGTYGSDSLQAIQQEITGRLQEINRISQNTEFNGIDLMSGTVAATGIDIQVGMYAESSSQINLAQGLFKDASVWGLFNGQSGFDTLMTAAGTTVAKLKVDNANVLEATNSFAAACIGKAYSETDKKIIDQTGTVHKPTEMLAYLDSAISDISDRITQIGAAQNRISSAESSIDTQVQNITSSLSTLQDTDVASESSRYVQAQILQQASATLLATANQLPSIALNLI